MSEQVDVVGAVVPLTWLYTHCRAVGMTCVSDSGKWEHDIALFIVNLQAEITALRERVAELGRYHDDYPPEDIAELQADMMRSAQTCRTALARAEAAEADAARLDWLESRRTDLAAHQGAEPISVWSITGAVFLNIRAAIDAAMSERK
jgi:hypothetical protein